MGRKKGNYVVRYNNELNRVPLGKLSLREARLMAAVCAYVKNKSTQTVTMSFDKVREISGYTDRDNKRLFDELVRMNKKLRTLSCAYESKNEQGQRVVGEFHLFQDWELVEDTSFTITVTNKFEYILNKLGANFTRFETDEYKLIEGKYAVHLYRLLKEYRTSGWYQDSVADLRELLNVPPSYKTRQLDVFVINPAIEELSQYFEELAVEKLYRSGIGRGGKVVDSLRFTFKPQGVTDEKTERTAAELRKLIAETELKIQSTAKAMDRETSKPNCDWHKYNAHKRKYEYFKFSKMPNLQENLRRLFPEGEQMDFLGME